MSPYLAQIRSNLRLMGRDRTVLFFNFFFPLMFFVIFALSFGGAKNAGFMTQVVDMVLVIGVLGSGFFGAGIRAVQDREANVLRRFKVAPAGPAPIIVASLVSGLVAFFPSVLMVLGLAHFWLHMPLAANMTDLLIFVSVGSLAFRAMGMIVAAVVNSPQESQILIQILYLPMLFLSGATFPLSLFPHWLQVLTQFIPASYLFQGMQSILLANGSLLSNWAPLGALFITMFVSVFIGIKLFRWEKEEKIARSAKLWILLVLAPFFLMGLYQMKSHQNLEQAKMLSRIMRRNTTQLIVNARIFIGDGRVFANGAVLVKDGRIAKVYEISPADTKSIEAEVVDASGKTLLPGLIDMGVHLGMPGGIYQNPADYGKSGAADRELAAYLYSGVTTVRSVGDSIDLVKRLRAEVRSGSYLGADLYTCGPTFTTDGGYGTEFIKYMPANMRQKYIQQTLRMPYSVDETKRDVDDLKAQGMDCITAILDAGTADMLFNRMDSGLYQAVLQEAHADGLLVATHTGAAQDVKDAVNAGSATVEHGSTSETIPAALFDNMKQKGIAYDPTLSAAEAATDLTQGKLDLLDRSMVQQVGPKALLDSTRAILQKPGAGATAAAAGSTKTPLEFATENLLAAWKTGVMLITGTDAGNVLVIHGPTVQREMELWVRAGIPPAVALQAATFNAAQALGAGAHIGSIQPGRDATLILVDGNPLEDISNMERITMVMFHGERIDRAALFDQN